MNTNSDSKDSWPKTAAGTVAWEVVFEDPDNGLLSLIGQAPSPRALRESAILIIEKLYTRKDDPAEVERFTREMSELIPDDLAANNLTGIINAVTGLLRQIKDFRIKKAAEHEEMLALSEGNEGSDRRARDRSPGIRLASAKVQKSKRPYLLGLLGAGAVAAVLALFIFADSGRPPPKDERTIRAYPLNAHTHNM